jgi:4-aminobutyrate aminotransferase-like enzyme
VRPNTLRLSPLLTVSEVELEEGLAKLDKVFTALSYMDA